MDYEKKYKEALKKAEAFYYSATTEPITEREVLANIFPELKESEDDKVRKEIISALKNANYKGVYDKHLAWLEKQGEQKCSVADFKAKDWYVSKVDGKIHNIYHSVDKVEPKFKVGDWITNGHCMGKVIALTDDAYLLDTEQGIPFSCEHNAHLWTIQDANPGDVLFEDKISSHPSPFIVIFKKKDSVNTFSSHCFIGFDGKFYEGEDEHYSENLHPATKEQRDLLFEKMKEAGYEWNVEKKELKKIHVIDEGKAEMDYCFTKMMNGEKVKPQSPTPMSYGKELEARMYEACNRFNAPNTDPNRYSAADLFYAGVEAGCNLNTPAEWSEEDERMLNHIIGYLHSGDDFQTGIDWLKSLKERYTWKPSDEQLDALHDAAVYVDKSMFPHPKGILMKLYKQLKKLREE